VGALGPFAAKHHAMITSDELGRLIRESMPDAVVEARDWTGTNDHYDVRVVSAIFAGVPLIDQHRLVYAAVDAALKDGRLHAIQIKTELPKDVKAL
jgi:stress-induced morphogen